MGECKQHNDGCDWNPQRIMSVYEGFIRSVIDHATRNMTDREDIYQEVCLTLLKKDDFSEVQNIEGYLYRIIVNKANEQARRKASADMRLRKYAELKTYRQETADDDEVLIADEAQRTIELVRQRLSDTESQAILLRYIKDYDNETAASMMDVKKETFIRYISVGLKRLRNIAKSQEGSE